VGAPPTTVIDRLGDVLHHVSRAFFLRQNAEIRAAQLRQRLDLGLRDDEVRQLSCIAGDDTEHAAVIAVDDHRFRRPHRDLHFPRAQRRIDLLRIVQNAARRLQSFVLHEAAALRDPKRQAEQRARDIGDVNDVGRAR
jgi:hypothetical protein